MPVAIAAGTYHAVALKADGTVWDWGYNAYGQLGDGTMTTRYVAVGAIGVTNAIAVAAGQYHTLAVKMDGTVMRGVTMLKVTWRWDQHEPQHTGSSDQSYGRDLGERWHPQRWW